MKNITPVYAFGFGLSYTKFTYTDLKVSRLYTSPYTLDNDTMGAEPNTGTNTSINYTEYVFPISGEIPRYQGYIYPYLDSANPAKASMDTDYGLPSAQYLPSGFNDSSQQASPAGGAPGGNPGLWGPVVTVSANISNTGAVAGHEVAQLYVGLGGDEPPRILGGFDRLYVEPGKSVVFAAQLLRRDVSTWDPATQDWVPVEAFTVHVGISSRNLPLSAQVLLP